MVFQNLPVSQSESINVNCVTVRVKMRILFASMTCVFIATVTAIELNSTSLENKSAAKRKDPYNSPANFMYVVSIRENNRTKCNGVMVSQRYALAVPKCFGLSKEEDIFKKWTVWVPITAAGKTGRNYNIKGFDFKANIGVILLHRNHDKLNHVLIEAPLAENPPTDSEADVVGYKSTKNGKRFERIKDIYILKENDCMKLLEGVFKFRKDQICAERRSKSIITGIGDVLVQGDEVQGLQIFSGKGKNSMTIDVFTDVSERISYNYINDEIRILEKCDT